MTMDRTHPTPGDAEPRLYHNPSSYFSMIARLALAESRIEHEEVFVDLHFRGSQQSPAYAKLNPNMTVPTLVLADRILIQSRDILSYAMTRSGREINAEAASWIDLHYSFPIEDLTFGGFLAHHALARAVIPAKMRATHRRLLRLAAAYPDLADAYRKRTAVFTQRERTFDSRTAKQLEATRRKEAVELLDRLECHLTDGRDVLVPPSLGAADVVWTVFLTRIEFTGMAAEISRRPALVRYWQNMRTRPSFAAADIWTKLHFGRLVRAILFA